MKKNINSLRLVVFDLDGTIVDSQHMIASGMKAASGVHGFDDPGIAAVRQVVGLPLLEAIRRLFPLGSENEHLSLTETYKETIIAMRKAGIVQEPLFPYALETIRKIDDEGSLLGIATGKPYRGLVNTLEPHDILDRFLTVQTADRAPGKPSPEMLFRAMRETGASEDQTVMVGDTTFDMEMAKNARTKSIGVAWGYHGVAQLVEAGADCVVSSFLELPQVINDLLTTKES